MAEQRHYEISAVVTTWAGMEDELTPKALEGILTESGEIEGVERITVRELET